MSKVREKISEVVSETGALIQQFAYGKWVGWTVGVFVVLCVLVWFATREPLSGKTIRIATAARGGQYYHYAQVIGKHLVTRTRCRVKLIDTEGSVENRALLMEGKADLAILQHKRGTLHLSEVCPS